MIYYNIYIIIPIFPLFDYSAPLEGKNKAVEVNAVPALVALLGDKSPDVKANAAGALML